jgi:hypothetical protein
LVNYNQIVKKRLEKEKEMKSVANFRYLLRIANFGTYNVDKLYGDPNNQMVNTQFSIKGKPDIDLKGLTVFHITGEGRVVLNYTVENMNSFRFSGKDKNSLLVVLPENGIALLDHKEFKQLTNKTDKEKPIDLKLNLLEGINTASELKSILKDM